VTKPTAIDYSFWRNKRVLVTGHTGFKGGWLTIWLSKMGAKVFGISLPPLGDKSLFEDAGIADICTSYIADIRDRENVRKIICDISPEIIFHLAAQPLVDVGYQSPLETYETNFMGTVNILDISRHVDELKVFIVVTTDKVYEGSLNKLPYVETDRLGGRDPYNASKAAVELAVSSYSQSYLHPKGISVSSARAGNVMGGGDWSKDRLIPDAIKAWSKSEAIHIRYPHALRPWQHVLEPLYGYLVLAQQTWNDLSLSGAYNFRPEKNEVYSVKDVVNIARSCFSGAKISFDEVSKNYESPWLLLNSDKAKEELGVVPKYSTEMAIKKTIDWYINYMSDEFA
jgi:CDP-glucose 4,6-dehydratase